MTTTGLQSGHLPVYAGCTTDAAIQTRRKRVAIEKPRQALETLRGGASLCAVIIAAACLSSPVLGQEGSWVAKAPMPTPRSQLVGGVIDGTFYVVGGSVPIGDGITGRLEAFDTKTNTWTAKALISPRVDAAAVVFDGKLYVVGGLTWPRPELLSRLEVYDPKTDTWISKASMARARRWPP